MPTFDSFDDQFGDQVKDNKYQKSFDFTSKKVKGSFLSRVFLTMALCFLLTSLVAAFIGFSLNKLIYSSDPSVVNNALSIVSAMTIVSAIGLLVMSFVLPSLFAKGKHNIFIPLMIYALLMGVLLSSFVIYLDWFVLVEAFVISCLMFGIMALFGYLSKGRLAGIGAILSSLIIGIVVISIINYVCLLRGVLDDTNYLLAMVASLLMFAFIMFVTLYDVHKIKKIAEQGDHQDVNLTHYCAFILYSDFIAIFVKIIYFLGIFSNKRD